MQNRLRKFAFFRVFTVVILLAPSAISQADEGEPNQATSATQKRFAVKKLTDLPFGRAGSTGSSPSNKTAEPEKVSALCDVYLPVPIYEDPSDDRKEVTDDKRWPVVLVIHGGGWITGNKWTMDRHARQLAGRGIAAVSINYRLAPQHKFPSQVDDVRSALVWIGENSDRYSFDTDRVGIYGYSAGGHLASLVAMLADEPWRRVQLTTAWQRDDPRFNQIPKIRAVCVGGPPTDFRDVPPDSMLMSFFLGGTRRDHPDVYSAASPLSFASPDDPPFAIIHGDADGMVPIANGQNLHRALLDHDVESQFHPIIGRGHFLAFASPKLSEHLLAFFEKQLLNPLSKSAKR